MKTKTTKTTKSADSACANLEQIANRAYAIWQEQGCPDGRDMEHWIEAEAHFLACRNDDAEKQNGVKI